MNEFTLIDSYFKILEEPAADIIIGIGDDAACLDIPSSHQLLVTTDSLVVNVHFLENWDPYIIAWKALMVNLSDIAAMGGIARFASLALTLPEASPTWLARFSEGLSVGLKKYGIALIGGDITKGPLCITLTIHGLVPKGKAISRKTAKPGDLIWLSGNIGAAALAVTFLQNSENLNPTDKDLLMDKLQKPIPRLDLSTLLQSYASSSIDISDGLSADLGHICAASHVGACLFLQTIPVHPLVEKYQQENAAFFALAGGDDYELCFTIPKEKEAAFQSALEKVGFCCYKIGEIQKEPGLRLVTKEGKIVPFKPEGYRHF